MGTTTATAGDHPAIATTKSTTTMNRMTAALLLLLLGTATATLVTAAPPKTRTIEILSDPIVLKYGEVHNRYQEPLALPEDVVAQFCQRHDGHRGLQARRRLRERLEGSPHRHLSAPLYLYDGQRGHHEGLLQVHAGRALRCEDRWSRGLGEGRQEPR